MTIGLLSFEGNADAQMHCVQDLNWRCVLRAEGSEPEAALMAATAVPASGPYVSACPQGTVRPPCTPDLATPRGMYASRHCFSLLFTPRVTAAVSMHFRHYFLLLSTALC